MKFYNTPKLSQVKIIGNADVPPETTRVESGEILKFHYVDGVYTVCTNQQGINVFPAVWTEVEILE